MTATKKQVLAKRAQRESEDRGREVRGVWTIDRTECGEPTCRPEMVWGAVVTPTASIGDYWGDRRVYAPTREQLDAMIDEYIGGEQAAKLLTEVASWYGR